jgi:hypothetical protein
MIDNVDRMSVNILPFFFRSNCQLFGGSVRGHGSLHHLPDQPGSVGRCLFVTYGPTRNFQSIFSSLRSGNEVFNFISNTSDVIGNRLKLIGNIADQVQVQVQVFGINQIN